jgi:autotransporter-associated beta strand protein
LELGNHALGKFNFDHRNDQRTISGLGYKSRIGNQRHHRINADNEHDADYGCGLFCDHFASRKHALYYCRMILSDSTAARVQGATVTGIVSVSSTFLQFMQYAAITVSTAISGTIGIIKNGIGGLTFSGACTYTGPTQINAGQIVLTGTSTLNGVISGNGSITKTGTTTLTLGGNNTYSGGTVYAPSAASATITYSSSNAFGTGLFTAQGSCQIITGGNVTLPNNFQINTGTTLQYRTSGANTITVSGNIAGSGSVTKTGNGTLRLDGTLTYTGSTTITAGFIRAIKTTGASTATATFQSAGLSLVVSFNVPPTAGMTFRFFQGTTTQTYATVTLVGAPGRTGTYNSTTSTLTIA